MMSAPLIAISLSLAASTADRAPVELIGRASIAGDALDRSGLESIIGDRVPHNRLGSFGSGIDYTGKDDLYIACDDRGPGDGASAFRPRVQVLRITIDQGAIGSDSAVRAELVGTTMLTDERGEVVWGYTGGYSSADPMKSVRLDPEGIRVNADGSFWICEEYGPWIERYDATGRRLERIAPPEKFMVDRADGDAPTELKSNRKGRQPNRGFEGIAMNADGSMLWTILQSPLIQDDGAKSKREGLNIRVMEMDLKSRATREMVYPLESARHGVSEILWVKDQRFLVLERDGKTGAKTNYRSIVLADASVATDVGAVESLPVRGLPAGVVEMNRRVLIDLLDPRFGLAGDSMPEKVEGLTWGPDLKDGRRTLIVTSDNDMKADQPTWVWVFAIDRGALGG